MDGWCNLKLGEVLKLEYGKPLPAERRADDGEFPAYGANGVKCRTNDVYWEEPSIIVGRKGSAGEINLVDGGFWPLDVTYFVVFDESEYDLRFLYYMLSRLNLPSLAKGVKPGLNRNDVYAIEQWFPPLPEQERIVAILDEAFAAIATATANAEKNLVNAREVFESQLNSIFTQKGDGWVEIALGNIAAFKNGLNFTKTSKGALVKIVGVKDFQSNYWVPMDELDTVQIEGMLSEAYTLKKYDILTVRSNGNKQLIGRCILADDVPERVSHSGFTIRIRVHSSDADPAYLVHYLKSGAVREMLVKFGGGTNISSLNQKSLSNLTVHLPKRDEQSRIVTRIEAIKVQTSGLASIYQKEIDLLAELKQSILHKAFTGELTAEVNAADHMLREAGV